MAFTGAVTRVGNSRNFGAGVFQPRGIAAVGTKVYMIDDGRNALYSVNITTGVAARIGSATNFEVNQTSPAGLAAIGNTLYMMGRSPAALYTVNTTTGVATQVGSATNFSINRTTVESIASIGNTLYAAFRSPGSLYTVNTTTGVATIVGTLPTRNGDGFGVNEWNPGGLASISNTLYMVGKANNVLYELNTTTSDATRVGNVDQFGISLTTPEGLTSVGTDLYMLAGQSFSNTALYKFVDTPTPTGNKPTLSTPFPASQSFDEGGYYRLDVSSHFSDNPTSYSVSAANPISPKIDVTITNAGILEVSSEASITSDQTYTFSITATNSDGDSKPAVFTITLNNVVVPVFTGEVERVGGAVQFNAAVGLFWGAASADGKLYASSLDKRGMYVINFSNGTARRVGSGYSTARSITGLGGLGDRVFGVGSDPAGLFEIDTTTGVDTRIGNATNYGVNETSPGGMTSVGRRLVFSGDTTQKLYYIDKDTGVATEASNIMSATRGLAVIGTTIFGIEPYLYTINVATGAKDRIGNFTNYGISGDDFAELGLAAVKEDGVYELYMVDHTRDVLWKFKKRSNAAAPTLSTPFPKDVNVREGSSYTYDVSSHFDGIPEPVITLGTVSPDAPALSASINSSGELVISVAPIVNTDTEYTIPIIATNSQGAITQNFTLTVKDVPKLFTGSAELVNTDASYPVLNGVASIGSAIYAAGLSSQFYSINLSNNQITRLGFMTGAPSTIRSLASIGNTLYLISANRLYSVDPTSRRVSRIGSVENFNVSENNAYSITSVGNTLYMASRNGFYTVNTTTGEATRIGSANRFGVNEVDPIIVGVGDELYMVGNETNILYNVDTVTGNASRVGNFDGFNVSVENPSLAFYTGTEMYMYDFANNNFSIYRFIKSSEIQFTSSFPVGQQVTEGQPYMYNVGDHFSAAPEPTFTLGTVSPATPALNPTIEDGVLSLTAPQVDANTKYTIPIIAANTAGTLTENFTLTVIHIENAAPTLDTQFPVNVIVDEGDSYTYDVSSHFSGIPTPVITLGTVSPTTPPLSASINMSGELVISVAPTIQQDTVFSIPIIATNSVGSITRTFIVSVINADRPSLDIPFPTPRVTEGSPYNIDLTPYWSGTQPITITLDATDPTGLNARILENTLVLIAPDVSVDTEYTLELSAKNVHGTTTAEFYITVTEDLPTPVTDDESLRIISIDIPNKGVISDTSVNISIYLNRAPKGKPDASDFHIDGINSAVINSVTVSPTNDAQYTVNITRDLNDIGLCRISFRE